MTIEIFRMEDVELEALDLSWSGLWYEDLEEAGVEECFFAFDGSAVVGFQTVSCDGLCVAIEVAPSHQGQGIATMMVEESSCWNPERNECPEFWAKIADLFASGN